MYLSGSSSSIQGVLDASLLDASSFEDFQSLDEGLPSKTSDVLREGGWLNGVMTTAEESPMGRLDNKPTVEQMFGSVVGGAPAHTAANGAVIAAPAIANQTAAPAPAVPPPIAAPAPTPALQMTAAANGVTLEAYLATPGWTEQMLIDQGLAIRPSFV